MKTKKLFIGAFVIGTMGVVACQQESDLHVDSAEVTSSVRAIMDYALEMPDFTEAVPADVILVDSTTVFKGGNAYLIDNYEGNVPFYGAHDERAVIYVTDNWDVQNWNLETGLDVVVMPGATLSSTANSSLVVNGNSNLYIMPGATATFANDFLYFSNDGSLYDLGELNASFIEINLGTFYVGPDASATVDQFPGYTDLSDARQAITLGFVDLLQDGYNSGKAVTEYNVNYIPGQTLYVLEGSRTLSGEVRIADNEAVGATLSTADVLGSTRLYLPVGTDFSDELPKILTFNVTDLVGNVTGLIKVIFR